MVVMKRRVQTASRRAELAGLGDLARLVQRAEGFHPLVAALKNGHGATVDGAWGSSASLAAAALGLHAPQTLLIVIAHPRDLDAWADDIETFTDSRPIVFPAWEKLPSESPNSDGLGTDRLDEIAGQRLRVLKSLSRTGPPGGSSPPRFLLTTIQAILQPVPDRGQLAARRRLLRKGEAVDLEEMTAWLVDHHFQRTEIVSLPGEFSRRGGILDVYSPDADASYRVEFFGDEIDSIRQFSPQTQRSLGDVPELEITAVYSNPKSEIRNRESVPVPVPVSVPDSGTDTGMGRGKESDFGFRASDFAPDRGHIGEHLPVDAWTALVEPDDLQDQGKHYLDRLARPVGLFTVPGAFQQLLRFPNVRISALPIASMEATCHLRVESVERFTGDITKLRGELESIAGPTGLPGNHIVIACHNEAEAKRLGEVLGSTAQLLVGKIRAGFRLVDAGIVVLSDHELFHREEARPIQPRRRLESRAIDSFLDLAEDDLVVHVSHGIARYRGMQLIEKHEHEEEHLILEFREGVRVYVPVSKIDLVQKYVGGSRTDPELSKYGGTSWQNRKDRVEAAVIDMAGDMVELQALREAQPGIALPPDTEWQAEFEAAFPFQETPDQISTIVEIKRDMERTRPMDRLICGDVGYGKTELAIRAAFKTVDNGKQVAVLVPTTVLAEQHYRTFSQRLAEYPFVVECISRFRTGGEQKSIIERLSGGGIDIIIGTHRLVSADVKFKDLALVIIDEEQRFGVEHKERLKRLRQTVDVLTMTATPIPRTLHLALLGIRDISNLETPPADRLAIETRISRFDPDLIRHAILRELNRDGQIYFVHNRVYNIQEIADKIQSLVPEAKIAVGHGQMHEHELERAMLDFVQRKTDILVATTIIESGLDIPNVNTIFINQADRYGLADLHQLRGRVGRYKNRAYAYLLLDSERSVTPVAIRRLKAIEEFTELGAGFKIAMRDLEIRGAGNILGTQQSGHIAAIGYELYCQLLENAVRRLKNQPIRTHLEVSLELPWPAYLPRDYVPGQRLKIEVYRRLSRVRRPDRLEDFRQELRDRYGPIPEPAEWMLRLAEIRLLAARWQVAKVHLEPPAGSPRANSGPTDLVLGYRNRRRIERMAKRSDGRLRIVDGSSAYFRLKPSEIEPEALFACLKHLLRLPMRSV